MYIKDMFDTRELSASALISTLNGTLIIPYGISRNDVFTLQVDSLHNNIVVVDSPVTAQRINVFYSFMRTIGELQGTKSIMATLVDCDSTGEGLVYKGLAEINATIMKGNYQNGASVNLNTIVDMITDRRNTCYDVDCHDYQSYNRYAVANGLDQIPPMIIFLDNIDAVFRKEALAGESTLVRQALQTILKYARTMGIVVIASVGAGYTADMEFLEKVATESEIVRLPNE